MFCRLGGYDKLIKAMAMKAKPVVKSSRKLSITIEVVFDAIRKAKQSLKVKLLQMLKEIGRLKIYDIISLNYII